jgi:hypothetical protein
MAVAAITTAMVITATATADWRSGISHAIDSKDEIEMGLYCLVMKSSSSYPCPLKLAT